MTDESTVDCHNCGRANPEWAQVCRSCGVALRQGEARIAPTGRFPTDQASLISIGAVIGTILLAVLLGLFISNLNPTEPTVGEGTPSPTPSVEPSDTPAPSVEPIPSDTPAPTPEPTPALPGSLAFGTEIGEGGQIAEPVDTFTPDMTFAYSVSMPDGFGGGAIENEIVRLSDEVTVLPRQAVNVNAEATAFGYVLGPTSSFIQEWGTGEFEWRTYVGDTLIARGRFTFAEG